jgi:hypothetical protein
MLAMKITLDGDRAWPELRMRRVIHVGNDAPPIGVVLFDGGLASGRPSVALRIDLPDGSTVIAETTASLFCKAARAIEARHPNLFVDH